MDNKVIKDHADIINIEGVVSGCSKNSNYLDEFNAALKEREAKRWQNPSNSGQTNSWRKGRKNKKGF